MAAAITRSARQQARGPGRMLTGASDVKRAKRTLHRSNRRSVRRALRAGTIDSWEPRVFAGHPKG